MNRPFAALFSLSVLAAAAGKFGERGGGWARLLLAVSDEVLKAGLGRLRAALARSSVD